MTMIVLDANWDEDAKVWYAVARDDAGLITEASDLDALRSRISQMLPDLLDLESGQQAEFELIVHSVAGAAGPVAAE